MAIALAAWVVTLGALVVPARVLAAGGPSIAAAPVVVPGQQQFGNTATDSPTKACGGSTQDSWWALQANAGDTVTIDWEGPGARYLRLYPVGTTDFNVSTTPTLKHEELNDNGRRQTVLTVPVSGSMPLRFSTYDCDFGSHAAPGPYDFVASVTPATPAITPPPDTEPAPGGDDSPPAAPDCSSRKSLWKARAKTEKKLRAKRDRARSRKKRRSLAKQVRSAHKQAERAHDAWLRCLAS